MKELLSQLKELDPSIYDSMTTTFSNCICMVNGGIRDAVKDSIIQGHILSAIESRRWQCRAEFDGGVWFAWVDWGETFERKSLAEALLTAYLGALRNA